MRGGGRVVLGGVVIVGAEGGACVTPEEAVKPEVDDGVPIDAAAEAEAADTTGGGLCFCVAGAGRMGAGFALF